MEKLNFTTAPQTTPQTDPSNQPEASEQLVERVFLGKTKDGAEVYDRTDSHLHREGGLTPELLSATLNAIDTEGRNFLKEQVNFDRPVGEMTCVEVGPEDEIMMAYRKNRSGLTPIVKNREAIPCSTVTVVLRKSSGDNNSYTLITGYIGKGSPREPWDPNIGSAEERGKAQDFWQTHAIVYNDDLINWERTKAFEFMSEPAKKAELIRQKVLYTGLFVDPEDLHQKTQPTLEKIIECPHVTISFRPEDAKQLNLDHLGQGTKIYAVGYGNDGKNEGLLVKVEADDPVVQSACDALEVPHITLSISKDGQAKNTANLEFTPLEQPFEIDGRYGLFSQNRILDSQEKLEE